MQKKYILLVIVILCISGIAVFEYSTGTVETILFDQIPYNYTSTVWIPPVTPDAGSIAGFYNINGQGKDFNFRIVLPGAELFDLHDINGTQICYDKNGLSGQGHINNIKITYNTLTALWVKDLKKAMFGTEFSGSYNMKCAAWNGSGTFNNNGKVFSGTFLIIGAVTDWEGNFTLTQEGTKIKIISSYIYYHHAQKINGKIKKVTNNTFYM